MRPQTFLRPPLAPRAADFLTIIFLILLPPVFFWRETLGWLTLGDQDAIFWFFPTYKLIAEQVRAGHLPLWNPYLYSGAPLFAQWQGGVLDPLNWIYLLKVTSRTLTVAQEASFAISLLSTFSYARSLGLKRRAGVVASVIYALSGFAVGRTIYPGLLHVIALVPLVLCFIEGLYRRGRWRDVAGGGLIIAWQLFAGHPQPFVYSSLLAASYILFCAFLRDAGEPDAGFVSRPLKSSDGRNAAPLARPRRLCFLVKCAVMFVAGVGLSAVQLLPAWEFARQSVRQQVTYEFFTLFSLHPMTLLATLFPFLHGQGKGIYHLPYWGPYWHQNEAQIYLGALAISLATAGALYAWRERISVGKFWIVIAVGAAILSLGKYVGPVAWVFYRVPLLGGFRSPNRHWMEVTLAVAILAGYAVDQRLRGEAHLVARVAQIAAGILAGLCCLVGAFTLWRHETAEMVIRRLPDLESIPAGFLQQAGAEFYIPVFAALSVFWVLVIFAHSRDRHRGYVLLLAVLIVDFNLYAAFAAINSPAKLENLIGRAIPPELAAGRGDGEPLRYHLLLNPAAGEFSPYWFFGHELATGYDPLAYQRYKTFSGIDEAGRSHLLSMLDIQDRTLDLLNVRYLLVSPTFLKQSTAATSDSLSSGLRWRELASHSPVTEYQNFRIYENLHALPRVWLVSRVETATEEKQLQLIRGEGSDTRGRTFDPQATALIEPEAAAGLDQSLSASLINGPSFPQTAPPHGAVRILKRAPDSMLIEIAAPQPSMFVLSEISFPGWRAKTDGRRVELYRVNYILRGVMLSAGKHDVELLYRPVSLSIGVGTSIVTALCLLALGWARRKDRNKKASGLCPHSLL